MSDPHDPNKPAGQQLADEARAAGDEARREADRLGERAREQAEGARRRAIDEAEARREAAGEHVGRVSGALSDAAREAGQSSLSGRLLDTASRGLDDVADHLKTNDLGDLTRELQDFGRRNPAAFLGIAAIAGFALARVATAKPTARSGADDPLAGRPGPSEGDYRDPATGRFY
ncbi:MAG: hypothetical protein ACFBWO_10010 [Paracoccaceae bacterium]